MNARAALVGLAVAVAACGSWQRVGTSDRPRPDVSLPQLFDPTAVYRGMGFLVSGPPLPFVASLRYLAGPPPDSTLAVFALSLANQALTFRREGSDFVAEYHLEVTLRGDAGLARQIARDETVRVRTFQETLRADESVIYQHYLAVHAGTYVVSVLVRDRHGPALGRQERTETVPGLGGGRAAAVGAGGEAGGAELTAPLPFYEGEGRSGRGELPQLLVNPRATLPFGSDTVRLYVEAYGVPRGSHVAASIQGADGAELWRDTVALSGDQVLARARITLPPERLPVGQAEARVELVGRDVRARSPLLVSFSHQWVITNFEDIISLLRFFDRTELVTALRDAPAAERPALWREFWAKTDPVPITPENEALDDYFRRIQTANVRFREEGGPGWLTDRGEVFITLGEPDDVLDLSHDLGRSTTRAIRWMYNSLRLTLYFEDQTGFGRYRLRPLSRAEYQRVLARVRRSR